MKISRISVWAVDLPFKEPYRYSGGRLLVESLDSTFVRIETDGGLIGWGEGCPWGHSYLPAHGPGIRAAFETIAPNILGHDPTAIDALNHCMDEVLPGHWAAKSAIDIACWDILGQAAGLPIWKLLGGAEADPVPVNSSISTGTPDEMLAKINRAAAKGYRTHSAKVGGTDIAADIERIDAISAGLPGGHKVTFDVNRAWLPGVAKQVMMSVSSRDWFEQPCETLVECAEIAQIVPQPIMLDECVHTFGDHLEAMKLRACQGVKVKPNRSGGLSRCRRIRDLGVELGWQMHVEDLGGSSLADTAAIHLAASTPKANRLASWLCQEHLTDHPCLGRGVTNENGFATPPSVPGLGCAPDLEKLGDAAAIYQ
ncbi:MAG: mandelate racemase/muconate lactonizing enzyme family protein [Pseudomonadota bacterium]